MKRCQNIPQTILDQGFIFIPEFKKNEPSASAIESIGFLEKIGTYEEIHNLKPSEKGISKKNSYSKTFGYGEFPLHTDFAHWFIPPRYMVLRCLQGTRNVSTRILDSLPLIKILGEEAISRTLVQSRKTIDGQRPILRILKKESSSLLFRWDSLFLTPSTSQSKITFVKFYNFLGKAKTIDFFLEKPGDTLIIDNWRVLHGRSPVSPDEKIRQIQRAYISLLK